MVTISKKGSRPNTFPSSRPAPSQCHVRTFQLNVKFKGGMFYVKICVAMQSRFLKLLRKERHLFCLSKTLVWMKVPLFSMKITIIFFINPDSGGKKECGQFWLCKINTRPRLRQNWSEKLHTWNSPQMWITLMYCSKRSHVS